MLSAVEGLSLLDPEIDRAVIPITIGIIVALFMFQRRGTARVGGLFGPIMVVWFVSLGNPRRDGDRARARGPRCAFADYALAVLAKNPGVALTILGAVFLVLTGGEALYADMGHFGKQPVRLAWFTLVWPGLLINYFGQGALLSRPPVPISNPFYALAPLSVLPLLVVLATAAAVIASQATISGAFSITRQAVQLDLLPACRSGRRRPTSAGRFTFRPRTGSCSSR